MTGFSPHQPSAAGEGAIVLYQEIMRVDRASAEHAYLLIEAALAAERAKTGSFVASTT